MSLIDKLFGSSSSANLQRIKDDSEQRRAAKSSASMPAVREDVEKAVAALLAKRIKRADPNANKTPAKSK